MSTIKNPRLLLAIGLLFTTMNLAWAAPPSKLITGKTRAMLTGPYVSAAHVVELDLSGASKGHAQILLSLPGGRRVRLDREAFEVRSSGDAMWRGRSAQYANSEAVITIKNGLMVGRITLENDAYMIRPSTNGKHRLEKLVTRKTAFLLYSENGFQDADMQRLSENGIIHSNAVRLMGHE